MCVFFKQEDFVTLAGPCLLVGVVTVATVGCAVTFHQVSLLTTGFASADFLTQCAVGGAGWRTGTPSGSHFTAKNAGSCKGNMYDWLH